MATYRVTEDCIVVGEVAGSLLTDDDLAGLHIDQLLQCGAIHYADADQSTPAPVVDTPATSPVAEAVL